MTLQEKDLKDRTTSVGRKPYWDTMEQLLNQQTCIVKQARNQLRTRRSLLRLLAIENHILDIIF